MNVEDIASQSSVVFLRHCMPTCSYPKVTLHLIRPGTWLTALHCSSINQSIN